MVIEEYKGYYRISRGAVYDRFETRLEEESLVAERVDWRNSYVRIGAERVAKRAAGLIRSPVARVDR